MSKTEFPPLPKKKPAVFHHPLGVDLYDGVSMDVHAMKYAEACVAAERERWAATFTRESSAIAQEDAPLHRGYKMALSDMAGKMRA